MKLGSTMKRSSVKVHGRSLSKVSKPTDTQKSRPHWQIPQAMGALEPSDMTITHVNQTAELFQIDATEEVHAAEHEKSSDWLKTNSIEYLKLTLKDLIIKAVIRRPEIEKESGKVKQRMEFESRDLYDFEYKINQIIHVYARRIKWLMQGSRKVFGIVKGKDVGVLVDVSEANFGFGRRSDLQHALLHLIDEQLTCKRRLYFASYGSEVHSLWPDLRFLNSTLIDEAKNWVLNLSSQGGTNLLGALAHICKIKGIQTVLLILGSQPDQNLNIICAYLEQLCVGHNVKFYMVSYDCSDQLTNVALMKMALMSNGSYHCINSTCEDAIYTSFDVKTLLEEISKGQDVLKRIRDIRQGQFGSALITIIDQLSSKMTDTLFKDSTWNPPGHELPLRIEMPLFHSSSSACWITKNGLKAKGLDLYQVLAPNAYSFREEFIPVIRKTVQSQVHSKAMTQFQWHDGTSKNVHVDVATLYEYQKKLGALVKVFEKRIDWLSSSSRRIFGTIIEMKVVLLLDLSIQNAKYLVDIQGSLRLLLEQQMANKEYFNIIGYGEELKAWKSTLVKPTGENLQDAWRWILNFNCAGSRNILSGLHRILENNDQLQHNIEPEGIYVIISGVPDQPPDVLYSYLDEVVVGRNIKLHVVLFNVEDYDLNGAIPGRFANITKTAEVLRNLAHCTGGRFQWLQETGIIESDDISVISQEIEKAVNFSKKCALLVESVKKTQDMAVASGKEEDNGRLRDFVSEHVRFHKPVPSSHKQSVNASDTKYSVTIKDQMSGTRHGRKDHDNSSVTQNKTKRGAVFAKNPCVKQRLRGINKVFISDKDDQITTEQWMRLYSLSKLNLNLNKLAVGSECHHIGHATEQVKVLGGKTVDAKFCRNFLTVNISGALRHLLLNPMELLEFEKQTEYVLSCYLKRLQWLLSGSRQIFGAIVEKSCVFVIDTSGSMEWQMEDLKKKLISLIWEQLHKYKIRFNFIKFSKTCERWKPSVMEPSEENCQEAVHWVTQLHASGNTCTLEALQMAFEENGLEAIYLLTDGKPDTSTSLVLQEVQSLNSQDKVVINTISFNCTDSIANDFLQSLAHDNHGRYHSVVERNFDAHLFAHQLIEGQFKDPEVPQVPKFDGDDLIRLTKEIAKGRRYLAQSRTYRKMFESLKSNNEEAFSAHSCML